MPIREQKPTTNARRKMTVLDRSGLSKKKPEKSLVKRIARKGGRNNQGKTTARHRGGGARKMYRIIDFKRKKDDVPAKVQAIEYDPNRSVNVALLAYADGEKRYILCPEGLKVGDVVASGEKTEPRVGNCMPLASIPLGLSVHNIELSPGRGGQMVRSAGTAATLAARDGDYAQIILPSGETRRVHVKCRATIGQLGNGDHNLVRLGKAGRKRHMGRRPYVRGTAMNPVDHPMGGGEGRTKGGRHPVSRTGVLAKGGKTRKRGKPSDKFIVRRRTK
ncbi:MAG: 50S ribosomal protein L2 [Planctomycetota bacterium]|jgi:large subunit ribosomal protein L2